VKVRQAIRLIENDGWYLVATRGSHRQYKHPAKSGRVTKDLKLGLRVKLVEEVEIEPSFFKSI
jgi:predicted RNA binding protein YcfA (HicA-like mRNA interferase family)